MCIRDRQGTPARPRAPARSALLLWPEGLVGRPTCLTSHIGHALRAVEQGVPPRAPVPGGGAPGDGGLYGGAGAARGAPVPLDLRLRWRTRACLLYTSPSPR